METGSRKFSFTGLLFALLLALELSFVADMLTTRATTNLPAAALALVFLLSFILLFILSLRKKGLVKWMFILFTAVVLLLGAALYFLWLNTYKNGVYQDVDKAKDQVFAGKKVMAIVPHEDDELNLLGGVLEQYVKYGSNVYIVYVFNGDMNGDGVQRITEADAAMTAIGIPAENLIFLGYGDQLNLDGTPIYLCPQDEVLTSASGFSSTYGTDRHPPFNPGAAYTRKNLYQDIRTVLLRYTPDLVFCSDSDQHIDHQTVAMFFEQAMGEVLKARPSYEPVVLRGFTYSTAYDAPHDYYALNALSTVQPGSEDYVTDGGSNIYYWSDRLRLPVYPGILSRSIFSSSGYAMAECYASQNAAAHADGIINSDKVFWLRESGSLSYEAEFWVSSGDASVLNDFVLSQHTQAHEDPGYSDNTWVPAADDGEKRVIVKFDEPTLISRVVLYDNPSMADNVLEVAVRLDNGAFYLSGPLEPNGSGTEVSFDPVYVEEMEVVLMETEGSGAGLTELEFYAGGYEPPFSFIKLTNARGDFIYDYYIDPSGREELGLYAFGCSADPADYKIICIGEGCYVSNEEGRLIMNCPEGKSCTLTLMDDSGRLSDTVYIRNDRRRPVELAQALEYHMRFEFKGGENSNTLMIVNKLKELAGRA